MKKSIILAVVLLSSATIALASCSCNTSAAADHNADSQAATPEITEDVQTWTTTADATQLFKMAATDFATDAEMSPYIVNIDKTVRYQSVEGFGAAITGATCYNLKMMKERDRTNFLEHIFSMEKGLGVSLIRVSIGGSDFPATGIEFTWCDTKGSDSDPLENFAPHQEDMEYLIPILKEIYTINPNVKIIGSPWSAPKWMKEEDSWTSAPLKSEFYRTYGEYFVKWIQYMESKGFNIFAVTPQNEPLNRGNSISMFMGWRQQRDFIKYGLGPAITAAGLDTKILIFDHNYNYDNMADQSDYPILIYADPEASKYIAGSAWHNYGGDVSELEDIAYQHPDKEIYFTEASIGEWNYNFGSSLLNDFESIFIGTLKRMGKGVTLWNLMLDDKKGPYSPAKGSCKTCYGAVDISSSDYRTLTYRTHYYQIAHASRVIRPGAVRLGTSGFVADDIEYLVFGNPDGSIGVIFVSKSSFSQNFVFATGNHFIRCTVPAMSLVSVLWQE